MWYNNKSIFWKEMLNMCNTCQNENYKATASTIPETYIVNMDCREFSREEVKLCRKFYAGKFCDRKQKKQRKFILFNQYRNEIIDDLGKFIRKLKIIKGINIEDTYESINFFKNIEGKIYK